MLPTRADWPNQNIEKETLNIKSKLDITKED